MTAATPSYQGVPQNLPDEKQHRIKMAKAINSLLQGKMNVTQTVTLTANAASTTITDPRISANNVIIPAMATTAHGAAALSSIYITNQKSGVGSTPGSATINHVNDANTDKTIVFVILG